MHLTQQLKVFINFIIDGMQSESSLSIYRLNQIRNYLTTAKKPLAKVIIEKFFDLRMHRFIEGRQWKIVKGFLHQWDQIFPRLLKTDCSSLLLHGNRCPRALQIISSSKFMNLTHLNLQSNFINSLELLPFIDMPNLKQLDLWGNKILTTKAFQKCTLRYITSLTLDKNIFDAIQLDRLDLGRGATPNNKKLKRSIQWEMENRQRSIGLEINSRFNGASILAKVDVSHVRWMGPLSLTQRTKASKGIRGKFRKLKEINRPEKPEIELDETQLT